MCLPAACSHPATSSKSACLHLSAAPNPIKCTAGFVPTLHGNPMHVVELLAVVAIRPSYSINNTGTVIGPAAHIRLGPAAQQPQRPPPSPHSKPVCPKHTCDGPCHADSPCSDSTAKAARVMHAQTRRLLEREVILLRQRHGRSRPLPEPCAERGIVGCGAGRRASAIGAEVAVVGFGRLVLAQDRVAARCAEHRRARPWAWGRYRVRVAELRSVDCCPNGMCWPPSPGARTGRAEARAEHRRLQAWAEGKCRIRRRLLPSRGLTT